MLCWEGLGILFIFLYVTELTKEVIGPAVQQILLVAASEHPLTLTLADRTLN